MLHCEYPFTDGLLCMIEVKLTVTNADRGHAYSSLNFSVEIQSNRCHQHFTVSAVI